MEGVESGLETIRGTKDKYNKMLGKGMRILVSAPRSLQSGATAIICQCILIASSVLASKP
jgi:hypothetical protein